MRLDLDLARMLRYESWANREALLALQRAGSIAPPRAGQIMAHILGASHLWLARLQNRPSAVAVWPDHSIAQMPAELHALDAQWIQWLNRLPEDSLENNITYTTSKGERWTSTVRDILTHVFLHASYHRGQIATLLGQAGSAAAYTDFIHATRQGLI